MKILDVLVRSLRRTATTARGGARKPGGLDDQRLPAAPRAQRDPGATGPSAVEAGFPQLEIARDPERMREVFQRRLRPLGEEAYRVRKCRISRSRAREHGERYVLLYDLRLEESGTGRERTQLVSGVMHAEEGRTRREWEELRRSGPGRGVSGGSEIFEPYAYIPELEMLVQVFPYDYRLPTLHLLLDEPSPELESPLLARFGPGDWRAEVWDVEPVRYLPETRATLKLTVRARDGASRVEERRFYVKVYREEEAGEQTYRVLRALWEKAETGGEGFTVGRPIAYLGGLRALIQEEIPGVSLREILLEEDEEAIPAVLRAARALAALHLDEDVPTPPYSHAWREKEISTLERRGEALRRVYPHLGPEAGEIVGVVIAVLQEAPIAPTHGELKPDHILFDGEHLALVDLDAFAEADPLLDVGNILSLLVTMPLNSSLSQKRAREATRAFAEEYLAHVPESWRERLYVHYAGALLRRAAGLSSSRKPSWPEKIEALIEEARGSLAGQGW